MGPVKRDVIRAAVRDLTCVEMELLLADTYLCVVGEEAGKQEPVCEATMDALEKFYALLGLPLARRREQRRFVVRETGPGRFEEVPGEAP